MATQLVHTGGPSGYPLYVYVDYSYTQNISANTSTITCGMYITCSAGLTIGAWGDWNGSYVGTTSNTFDGSVPAGTTGTRRLTSGQKFTVNHNADGTATATIKWKWGVNSSWGGCVIPSGSFNISLPTIPRKGTLTSAPNFTDEENPTIHYSNPAGNKVSKLQACIGWTGGADIPYRDVPKTGTSYTFYLTETERETLRKATTTSNTRNVTFYLYTYFNGEAKYSTLTKTLTIVNANPTLNPTYKDNNTAATALTGSPQKLIRGFSDVEVVSNPKAYKHATIVANSITMDSQTITGSSGAFGDVFNGKFTFFTKDSRGNTASKEIQADVVPYFKPTCNIDVEISVAGVATIKTAGNIFNQSFGAVNNSFKLSYRFKETHGQEWGAWIESAFTPSDKNEYRYTIKHEGLDYKKQYVFQCMMEDKLSKGYSAEVVAKALPIYDWGKNDFNFNVPVSFQGKSLYDIIYPVGCYYWSSEPTNPKDLFGGSWEQIKDRFVFAAGSKEVDATGGEETHTLTIDEMPSHTHKLGADKAPNEANEVINPASNGSTTQNRIYSNSYTWPQTQSAGGGKPHNNMPPYIVAYCWHRVR